MWHWPLQHGSESLAHPNWGGLLHRFLYGHTLNGPQSLHYGQVRSLLQRSTFKAHHQLPLGGPHFPNWASPLGNGSSKESLSHPLVKGRLGYTTMWVFSKSPDGASLFLHVGFHVENRPAFP